MQLKMEKKAKKFDRTKVEKLLKQENEYIIDFLKTFEVPDSIEDEQLEEMYLLDSKNSTSPTDVRNLNKKSRAQDTQELQDRMELIKNKLKSKKSKMSGRTIKKREMKKLKKQNMLQKKFIKDHRAIKEEQIEEEKIGSEDRRGTSQQIKPIFNEEGKLVFSKFDFASHPGAKVKKTKKDKVMRNPETILKAMKDQKKQLSELVEQGAEEKAREVKEQLVWKKVFDKTEGKKVKDDPTLLHKAVKKRQDQKNKSKKKWAERKEKLEQDIAQRQKKRQENINKKMKEKKVRKLKRASKRGRVIPGF